MSTEKRTPGNRDQLARVYSEETWRVYDLLDQSLDPQSPDSLHDVAGTYLNAGAVILDAGCRDAEHLVRLVQAHDASGVGIDPVNLHIERAKTAVSAAGLSERIEVAVGVMQELPYPDDHFDFVWCRDVVEQVDELDAALGELARVLKPGGHMLIYTVFVTDLLEPKEAKMLDHSLGNVDANLIESNVEDAFKKVDLVVVRKDVIGTEWREYAEERNKPASRALLRLARLRRQENLVVKEFGQDIYDHVQANLHWEIYQLLGKLQPTLYVLGHKNRA